MHTVTFYSFKGGVGRTMALVNTAAELAQKGRRVLIVDFDLEAPGIPTYKPFTAAALRPGIVDYVSTYIETQEAPNAEEYIVECRLPQTDAQVWVMPAGRRDGGYASRLANIDWQRLYRQLDGYLLFEDLKQQWQNMQHKFDYVLIDSRTGHTDVGGICTRQLPDAVVLMFFPNDQNILGLESVVGDIREDKTRGTKPVETLFCPSNVPDLDDEDEILEAQLDKAKRTLKYKKPSALIHHYDSLDLLEQAIFVVDRKRTRLAEEYRTLARAVVKGNVRDREGALAQLSELRAQLRRRDPGLPGEGGDGEASLSRIRDRVDRIRSHHPRDGEIAWLIAAISSSLGDVPGELDALDVALSQGYKAPRARIRRAEIRLSQGEVPDAVSAARLVLASDDVDAVELYAATSMLRRIDENWLEAVRRAPALWRLDPDDLLPMVEILQTDARSLDLAEELAKRLIRDGSDRFLLRTARTELSLIQIGAGKYEDAKSGICPTREEIFESNSISDVFNYAMAEWGQGATPPLDLLKRVAELNGDSSDADETTANYSQCMALTHAALGNRERAIKLVRVAKNEVTPSDEFSCWRYLRVDRIEMKNDLDEMERAISGGALVPAFVTRNSRAS